MSFEHSLLKEDIMSRLNHKRMRFLGVSAATIISVYALVGVMLAGALPKFLVQAQGPSDHTIYIPLSQGFSSAVAGEATHEEAEDTATNADPSPGEEWATHTSATGGYSFRYPANWKIEESKRGVLQLVPPAELLEEKIWFEYLYYEMPPAAKLKEWAQEYHAHPLRPAYEKTVVEADIAPVALRSDNQLLYVKEVSPQQGQSYLVANNHLVLQIFTLSSEEAHLERFRNVVNSLAFVADAPANLAELYSPDPAPWITTLEEWYEYEREQMEVSRAFNIRAQTGETSTEILEGLSEAARQDYERAIESNAAYLEELDRQRELNGGEWQPPPEPTTNTGIPDHCR